MYNVKNQVNDQDMSMITYVYEMGSKNYALIQNNIHKIYNIQSALELKQLFNKKKQGNNTKSINQKTAE